MKNFWKMFGYSAGIAVGTSIITTSVLKNGKKIKKCFSKDDSNKESKK